MDYLRRLLLRSLAVAREQGSPVFDPFAQVAGWQFDASAPAPPQQQSSAEPVRAAPPAPVGPRIEPVTSPLQPLQAPAPDAAAAGPPPAVDPPALAQAPPPAPDALAPPARKDDAGPVEPERALLTQADAFIRSLGRKPVVPPEAPAPAQGVVAPQVPAPHRNRAERATAQPDAAPVPVLVRPTIPPAIEPPRASPKRHSKPEPARAATAAAAAAAPGSAPPLAAPPERIVQTTVVVAPSARGLDDLAHSSGISRFGIGQS